MTYVACIGLIALVLSVLLPPACSLAFKWCVESRREHYNQRDWAVGSLLGCGGVLNILVGIAATVSASSLSRATGTPEPLMVAVLQGAGSLIVPGVTGMLVGVSLGRRDVGLTLAAIAFPVVAASSYAPVWLGNIAIGYAVWYGLLATVLLADVAVGRFKLDGVCGRCGYDLAGLESAPTCPECGAARPVATQLRRVSRCPVSD